MTAPLYAHDCDECTYLGEYGGKDLYHCLQGGVMPTLVVRFSSAAPDYTSGAIFADAGVPEFVEAEKRAQALGLPLSK